MFSNVQGDIRVYMSKTIISDENDKGSLFTMSLSELLNYKFKKWPHKIMLHHKLYLYGCDCILKMLFS